MNIWINCHYYTTVRPEVQIPRLDTCLCPSILHFRRIDASAGTSVEGYRFKSSEGSDPSLYVEIRHRSFRGCRRSERYDRPTSKRKRRRLAF